MTIVGVIANERVRSDLREPDEPIAYVPIAQAPRMQIKLAVRTRGDAMSIMPPFAKPSDRSTTELALADVKTSNRSAMAASRDCVSRCGSSAFLPTLSALLAALGLYGVRRALGQSATPRNRHSHGAWRQFGQRC